MVSEEDRRTSDRLAFAGVGLVLVVTPWFSLAGAPVVDFLAALVIVGAVAIWAWRGGTVAWGPVAVATAIAAIWAAVQIVPLPLSLLSLVSPGTSAFWVNALGPNAGWVSTSLDPPSTAHELLRLAALLGGVILTAPLFAGREGLVRLLRLITIAGALLAGWVLLKGVTDTPWPFTPPHKGPIEPRAILASLIGLAGLTGIAAAIGASGRARWAFGAAGLLAGGCLVQFPSSHGLLMYGVALSFLLIMVLIDRMGLSQRRMVAPALLLVAMTLVAVGGTLLDDAANPKLNRKPHSRVVSLSAKWSLAGSVLDDFALLGSGYGAAERVLPHYGVPSDRAGARRDGLVTPALGLGLPVALLVLSLLGLALLQSLTLCAGEPFRQVAVAGIVFLAGQSMVMPGLRSIVVALPGLMLLAALASGGRPALPTWSLTGVRVRWLAAVLVVTVLAVAWPAIGWQARDDEKRLAKRLAKVDGAPERTLLVESAARRHPASAGLWSIATRREMEETGAPQEALQYLRRLFFLNAKSPGAIRLAGRLLLKLEEDEPDLDEDTTFSDSETGPVLDVLRGFILHSDNLAAMEDLVDDTPASRAAVSRLLLLKNEPAAALAILDHPVTDGRAITWVQRARAHHRLGDLDKALECIAKAEELGPRSTSAYTLQAKYLAETDSTAEAIAVLDRGMLLATKVLPLLKAKVKLLVKTSRNEDLESLFAEYSNPKTPLALRAAVQAFQGELLSRSGDTAKAVEFFAVAVNLQPLNQKYTKALANLLTTAGRTQEATMLLEKSQLRGSAARGVRAAVRQFRTKQRVAPASKKAQASEQISDQTPP